MCWEDDKLVFWVFFILEVCAVLQRADLKSVPWRAVPLRAVPWRAVPLRSVPLEAALLRMLGSDGYHRLTDLPIRGLSLSPVVQRARQEVTSLRHPRLLGLLMWRFALVLVRRPSLHSFCLHIAGTLQWLPLEQLGPSHRIHFETQRQGTALYEF